MAEYIKHGENTWKDNDDEEENEPVKWPANRAVDGLVEAIHGVIIRESITKNALRVHIKRASCVDKFSWGSYVNYSA